MPNITKKDIVEGISVRTGITQVDAKVVVECFLDSIAKALVEGNNIEIRGFGRFKVRSRKARTARNPRTGEPVDVQAGVKPVFEASKELRVFLNDRLSPDGQDPAPAEQG
ncbi:MAG TPA: HU family DNA-binding protein [Fibrobacteraceae bacterium]|nr:HU family DNA-binding protein [Fibrobacteraceae bacterium]